jgi:excisionase family DNA binding protein
MRQDATTETAARLTQSGPRRWYSVAEVARMLGLAPMTLYRAIHAGEFPAVKIRGRYVIPTRALDEMEQAAVNTRSLVTGAHVSRPSAS